MSPRKPGWWPAELWPGAADEPTAGPVELPSPGSRGSGPPSPESGWEGFLQVLVASLQAGRATLWRLTESGSRWAVAAERVGSGWERHPAGRCPAVGHPFTWASREELVLQVPDRRLGDAGGGEGWAVVVPVPAHSLVLCLWFSSPPNPTVRSSVPALQAHLRWLADVTSDLRAGDPLETFDGPGG